MSNTLALDQADFQQQPTSRWIGVLTPTELDNQPAFGVRFVAGEGRSKKLYLLHELGSAAPLCAERGGSGVIFDGALYNRRELQRELGEYAADANEAEIILAAYQRWGADFLDRLRGAFALIIWDTSNEILLC